MTGLDLGIDRKALAGNRAFPHFVVALAVTDELASILP
jgi:hypothetical protein